MIKIIFFYDRSGQIAFGSTARFAGKNAVTPALSHPTLLFVTDFSDSSIQALRWAIPEAKRHHLHLSILYAYRLDQVVKKDNVVMSKKDLERDADEKFSERLEGMLKGSKVTFDFHSEVGFMRDRISEHAKKQNIVMLVMGEKLASAESLPELMEEIKIPMVIVPAGNT
jgi:nucleotide-binding universal stress UspA family protein